MASTVNTTIVIVRNGQSESTNLPNLPYAVFVAMQVAATGALSSLCSWGVLKMAEGDGVPKMSATGTTELSFQLITDHGDGGTSEVKVGYTGIADKDADEITATLKAAVNGVLGVVQPAAGKPNAAR
jgi:hypothetical protein